MVEPSLLADAIPALRELPLTGLRRLAGAAEERRVRRRAAVFRAGEEPAALHFLLDGRVRVVQEAAGRVRVVHWEEAGGTLGEVPTFADIPYPATAIADTALLTARIAAGAARRLAVEDPALATFFLTRLARRAAGLLEQLERVRGATVMARLARYVLGRSHDERDGTFTLGMSQAALAEELGTVREVLVRSLSALKRSGAIIETRRGRYRIAQPSVLRMLVG
jgi:CRP/FNR family transcriptional regulator